MVMILIMMMLVNGGRIKQFFEVSSSSWSSELHSKIRSFVVGMDNNGHLDLVDLDFQAEI